MLVHAYKRNSKLKEESIKVAAVMHGCQQIPYWRCENQKSTII